MPPLIESDGEGRGDFTAFSQQSCIFIIVTEVNITASAHKVRVIALPGSLVHHTRTAQTHTEGQREEN